jgi:hypothetical protein
MTARTSLKHPLLGYVGEWGELIGCLTGPFWVARGTVWCPVNMCCHTWRFQLRRHFCAGKPGPADSGLSSTRRGSSTDAIAAQVQALQQHELQLRGGEARSKPDGAVGTDAIAGHVPCHGMQPVGRAWQFSRGLRPCRTGCHTCN